MADQFQYPKLRLESPNLSYTHDAAGRAVSVDALYRYESVRVRRSPGQHQQQQPGEHPAHTISATPVSTLVTFRTQLQVPRLGVMLVGWAGNNGSTITAAVLANKHRLSFETKDGLVEPNYFGSITQAATVEVGAEFDPSQQQQSTGAGATDNANANQSPDDAQQADPCHFMPLSQLLPMADPNELVFDGWDIQRTDMAQAMRQAKVIDVDLQRKLGPLMQRMRPRPALFDAKFVAANQEARATNIIDPALTKWQQVQVIMRDIDQFKRDNKLDKVIVLWTANTERFCEPQPGCHDTAENLLRALRTNAAQCSEVSPSSLYALAAILSGAAYINGSPQNTFVPALIELAEQRQVFIGGDDFKSGQTKFKSVLVDFLVGAGIKPRSIVSYNHLGNNDGYNLSAPKQFRSKEISKSSVVDDMVQSNRLLYPSGGKTDKPDHCVVIKYVPFVGDSKRALDEYVSELMLGGRNTIVAHNTCEDSLLAAPLILDLVLLTELCQRVQFKVHRPPAEGATVGEADAADADAEQFQSFNSVLSVLSYLCKAPLVERGARVVNALFKQRACIENTMRALLALPPINHMDLEHKCSRRALWYEYPTCIDVRHELAAKQVLTCANGAEQWQPQLKQQQQQQVDKLAAKLAQCETIDANGNVAAPTAPTANGHGLARAAKTN